MLKKIQSIEIRSFLAIIILLLVIMIVLQVFQVSHDYSYNQVNPKMEQAEINSGTGKDSFSIYISGVVFGDNNMPLSDVRVKINDLELTTDENGVYAADLKIGSPYLPIDIYKTGYEESKFTLYVNDQTNIKRNITLHKSTSN